MDILSRFTHRGTTHAAATGSRPAVLILTPIKDATSILDHYCRGLFSLTYPHESISVGMLESDSVDNTYQEAAARLAGLRRRGGFRQVGLLKRDYGYRVPAGVHRGVAHIQAERRAVLARSRNYL